MGDHRLCVCVCEMRPPSIEADGFCPQTKEKNELRCATDESIVEFRIQLQNEAIQPDTLSDFLWMF